MAALGRPPTLIDSQLATAELDDSPRPAETGALSGFGSKDHGAMLDCACRPVAGGHEAQAARNAGTAYGVMYGFSAGHVRGSERAVTPGVKSFESCEDEA